MFITNWMIYAKQRTFNKIYNKFKQSIPQRLKVSFLKKISPPFETYLRFFMPLSSVPPSPSPEGRSTSRDHGSSLQVPHFSRATREKKISVNSSTEIGGLACSVDTSLHSIHSTRILTRAYDVCCLILSATSWPMKVRPVAPSCQCVHLDKYFM